MNPGDRPRLRLLETHVIREQGSEGVLFEDPEGLFEDPVFVPKGLLPVVGNLTGEKTLEEIARDLAKAFGQEVPLAFVLQVAGDLEARLCLEGPRVERLRQERREAFQSLEARPATHAGSSGYPSEPEDCRGVLGRILGKTPSPRKDRILGLVAPHIDFARGKSGYRAAYQALASAPPAGLYVIFGTGHHGPKTPILPCRKDFETPLGRVETDRAFVEAVAGACMDGDPYREEILHLAEHSVEFQVLFLKHLFPDRSFKIAPFLTGALGEEPGGRPEVKRLLHAFLEKVGELSEPVVLLAAADLAHQGPFFGDLDPVDRAWLRRLEEQDRASLDLLLRGSCEDFHRHIEAGGNPRRVCGTVPMYLVARLSLSLDPGCRGELLDYGQAMAPDGSQVVTFGSLAFRQDDACPSP